MTISVGHRMSWTPRSRSGIVSGHSTGVGLHDAPIYKISNHSMNPPSSRTHTCMSLGTQNNIKGALSGSTRATLPLIHTPDLTLPRWNPSWKLFSDPRS